MRRKLVSILFLFVIAMTVSFAFPKEARAAAPTVKMGNVALKNDAKWHAYNAKAPTISGWTAGKYRLSKDGKTLELNGIKYSGSKRGIYSSAALTVKTTGTNTFTCKGARGIGLGKDDDNLKSLTLTGAKGSVLNLKCTDARSICVYSCSVSVITVNATGSVYCEGNYNSASGKLSVTGGMDVVGNENITGGTLTTSGDMMIGGITVETPNGVVQLDGNLKITKGAVTTKSLEIFSKLTASGGTLTTNSELSCQNMTISGGTIICKSHLSFYDGFNLNPRKVSVVASGGTVTASSGIYIEGNLTVTGATITASSGGVEVVNGNLSISKGTLTGKNAKDLSGIHVDGNSTVSGTAKVVASAANSRAFFTGGTLTISGGLIEATNTATSNDELDSTIQANSMVVTGGSVTAKANGTAGNAISIEKTMTVKGGTVTGLTTNTNNNWDAIYAGDSVLASGGTLTGTGTASFGIYTPKNINVSGTATVNATSKDSTGLYTNENINVSGGTVNAKSDNSTALWADLLTVTAGTVAGIGEYAGINANNIKISGGTVNAKSDNSSALWADSLTVTAGTVTGIGQYTGVSASNLKVSGGYVYGESRESDGIQAYESFEMTGGKLTGKAAGEWSEAIYAYSENGNISIADDIWLSAPSEGYTGLQGNNYLRIYDSNHNLAKEATLQKVKDISVKSGPTTQMYREDYFNPEGISLDVTFADGTKSVVPYNYYTREMFTFSIPEDEALSVGTKNLTINCLTKTASTNFTVKDLRAPYISGTTSVDRIDLTWKPVEGAAYYQVYAKEEGADYFRRIGYVWDDTKFTDNNLSPGTTKEYYVTAYRRSTSNTVINSDASNTLKLTTELHAPVIMISGNTYDSLTVKWDAVDGAGEYRIYRKDDAQGYEEVTVTEDCEYTDTGLITGKEYTYYVIAATENDLVRSEASGEVAGTPSFKGDTTLRVSNNKKGYDLSWKAVDGATAYEIFRGNGANGGRSLIATVEGLSFTDNGASCYSTYNYTVLPIRMAGNRKFSGEESAAVVSKPIVKTNFTDKEIEKAKVDKTIRKLSRIITTASFSKKTMTVNYEKVKGAYDYRIEYKKRGEKSWKKKWTAKKNKYVIKGMKKGQFLEFRVAAFKYKDGKLVRGNYSAMSYRWYVTAKARLKAGKKSFKLNINKVRGATGYRIFYRDANGKGKEKNKFSKSPNVTIKGLKKGHTYIVEYRPVKKMGGHEYKGILMTKKVKVK